MCCVIFSVIHDQECAGWTHADTDESVSPVHPGGRILMDRETDVAGIGCEDTSLTVQDTNDTFPILDGITHEDTKIVQDMSGEAVVDNCSRWTVIDTAANINLTGGIPMDCRSSTDLQTSGGTVKIGSETVLTETELGALQTHCE
jgi:hypothetical protein